LKQAYGSNGAEQVPVTEWNRVVLRLVREALDDGERRVDRLTKIPLVVVAMTAEQVAELNRGEKVPVPVMPTTLSQVMQLSFTSGQIDAARYGATALDWQPFRAGQSIGSLIDDFERARRTYRENDDRLLRQRPLLVSYDHCLTGPNAASEELIQLQQAASIVVVDGVSLLHQDVWGAVVAAGLHTAPNASILGIGPLLPAPESPAENYEQLEEVLFTQLLMRQAHERARAKFHPGVGTCVFNIARPHDLGRWLHMAADHNATWTAERQQGSHPDRRDQLVEGPGREILDNMGRAGR
jgi:hypothetical protein